MKSNNLKNRLSNLKAENFLLEIIKENELTHIKGGDCPCLTTCGTFVDCPNKYKKTGDTTIKPTLDI